MESDQAKERNGEFIQSLVSETTSKIIQYVYEHGVKYEVVFAERECESLMLDVMRALRPGEEAYKAIPLLFASVQAESEKRLLSDETYRRGVIYCRRCKKEYERGELQSGELTRFSVGFPADYFMLCEECTTEYTYECQGLTHICTLCGKRYAPLWRQKGIPEKLIIELCAGCLAIPNIRIEAKKIQDHLERAGELKLPATLTLRQWITALAYFGWKCAYCSDVYYGIEHFLPITLGGGTTVDNCLPSCNRCNLRKRDKHPDHFTALFPPENIHRIKEYWNIVMSS